MPKDCARKTKKQKKELSRQTNAAAICVYRVLFVRVCSWVTVYTVCVCAHVCTLPFFGVSTHVLYPSVNMHVCVCTCVLAACNINMLGTAGLQKLEFD